MSKNKYTDLLCVGITMLALILTLLFMNGKVLGMTATTSDDVADQNGIFSARDLKETWEESTATRISLDHLSNFRSSGAYALNGNLYIINKGTYILSGNLKDRQIIVSAKNEKVHLVLSGISIEESEQPAIYVQEADKVFLTLAEGTENIITVGTLPTESTNDELSESLPDAAIFSADDLTINGSGSLSVSIEEGHGIKSKDDLVIVNGNISIDAGGTALLGKDSVRIGGGVVDLKAGNDGIKANNDTDEEKGYVKIVDGILVIESEYDGIQAQTNLEIEGGDITITTGGGSVNAEQKVEAFGRGGFMHGGNGFMSSAQGTAPSDENFTPPDGNSTPPDENFTPSDGNFTPPDGNFSPPDGNFTPPDGNFTPSDGNFTPPDGNFSPPDGQEHRKRPDRAMMSDSANSSDQQMQPPEQGFLNNNIDPPPQEIPNDNSRATTSEEISDITESESTNSDSYKGLKAGSTILISGGIITLDTKEDALHSDNNLTITDGTLTIKAGDDAIHAENVLSVVDGTILIQTSYEGLEAKNIEISGGNIDLTSSDDGFNASNGSTELPLLHITGGTIHVNANGDGLDSNGDLIIDGSLIIVDGPSDSGNGALDSGTESGGDLAIHSGTILALGSSGMAETFSENSTQYSFLCTFDTIFEEGDTITISDSAGTILYSYTAQKNGNSLVFSSPDLKLGETYTITAGILEQEVNIESITNGKSSGMGMGMRRPWQ